MEARLSYFDNDIAMKFAKHINSAGAVVTHSALPAATQELVKLRASQINGCGMCTDMHTKDALAAGASARKKRTNSITGSAPPGDRAMITAAARRAP